jgi:hypothetical protein
MQRGWESESLSVQDSYLHKTRKIVVTGMHIVMFMFSGRELEDTDSKPTCSKHSRIQPALHFELHSFELSTSIRLAGQCKYCCWSS